MNKYNSDIEINYNNIIKNRNINIIKYSNESWKPIDKPIDKIKILNNNNIQIINNRYEEELEKRNNLNFELKNDNFELNNESDYINSKINNLTLDNFNKNDIINLKINSLVIDNTLNENKLKESINQLEKLSNYIKIL